MQRGPEQTRWHRSSYTPRAQKVIEYAIEEAGPAEDVVVDTGHILLGILREVEGVAAPILFNLGVVTMVAREQILRMRALAEP